jgi:hypothetical protein
MLFQFSSQSNIFIHIKADMLYLSGTPWCVETLL